MPSDPHSSFRRDLLAHLPSERIFSDPLHTLAYGTDASFYRLVPRLVVKVVDENEVVRVLRASHKWGVPVTFRAAGTSLSGQAVTDSVLVVIAGGWTGYRIWDGARRISLQPGVIGGHANRFLAPFGRKIGPDPASIQAAMIGGIAANNASGMCCGTRENSYQTVHSLRLVLADGTRLNTADPVSRQRFSRSHAFLLEGLSALRDEVAADPRLSERIRRKFTIKNTTGYSLNALVDFEDPFDILIHLLIGSEGTLGFLSEIVYNTVEEHPHKASALLFFRDTDAACHAAQALKPQPVAAVELMDRAALRSVQNKPGMPPSLKDLSSTAAALLVETRAGTPEALRRNIDTIAASLGFRAGKTGTAARLSPSGHPVFVFDSPMTEEPVRFTADPGETDRLWAIRKGLFPSVGAMRRAGTAVIIEDVAFPMEHLAEATRELQRLFDRHGYRDTIIFGHALEGNLHFVLTPDLDRPDEVERYRRFMDDLVVMVAERYSGSLKAEHGTGRNMAPFVELEWGRSAYGLMRRIKSLFDPRNLLNPGVILNEHPTVHIENIKPMPQTHPLVDQCTECGFCECICPSRNLTLTPRQRITVQREIARLSALGTDPIRLRGLRRDYAYPGEQTCAVDGLCEVNCPVDINTGELTRRLRQRSRISRWHQWAADGVADNFTAVTAAVRTGLRLLDLAHLCLGSARMEQISRGLRAASFARLPVWNPYMPRGAARPIRSPAAGRRNDQRETVVYFPSCVSTVMGPARGDPDDDPLPVVVERVLERAGYAVANVQQEAVSCCGMPFSSKGFITQGDRLARRLEHRLLEMTRGGRYPVLCDTSPCVQRLQQVLDPRLRVYEPASFIQRYLLQRLHWTPLAETVAVHLTCSSRKMGLADTFASVARALAETVVIPDGTECCGFAGDKGFTHPELNAAALATLRSQIPDGCSLGVSNSRTCEIGLSLHSGLYYKSIFYLLDRCSRPHRKG